MAILNRLSRDNSTFLRFDSFFASRCGISGDSRPAILGIVGFAIRTSVPLIVMTNRESLNRGSSLRPLSAIYAQSSTIVHFCGHCGPVSKVNLRRKVARVWGIVDNCGQVL